MVERSPVTGRATVLSAGGLGRLHGLQRVKNGKNYKKGQKGKNLCIWTCFNTQVDSGPTYRGSSPVGQRRLGCSARLGPGTVQGWALGLQPFILVASLALLTYFLWHLRL